MSHKTLVIINTLSLGGVILVNILAGSGQIAGGTGVGDVSAQYDTLFAPVGYAFSIWGLIYLMLITRNLRESAAVGIWALVAIAIRQWGAHPEITVVALLASALLLSAIMYHGYQNRETSPFLKLKRGEF